MSTTQQSASVTVDDTEHLTSENVTNGRNFATSFFNFQSTGQDPFFVSIVSNRPQEQQTSFSSPDTAERHSGSVGTGVSRPSESSHSHEETVPSDSKLRDQPPPSYEHAQAYPAAYPSDKGNISNEEAPPYFSSTFETSTD